MENTNQTQNQPQNETSKKDQQQKQQGQEDFNTDGGLKKDDDTIPDSTNQSTGVMGSGQRQDSN